ncbi:ribosomal protein S9 [Thermodesulfatator indicus DSM 15286]|uniref:Small ribosomal subunit protein uS9 n=1 Tax=Thermodesulfatator indicus (strain DSM 15286 / JCM 11887 / CIR29812) TaxID=667014 RepID=F8A9L4_THEID|nr:30S ribosomal protein S9 [Thermodesulfatator indicus]AEH45240.1 ribosomal protein S9 [Thermodesulfatator indicus DSM 15286]
MAKNPERFYATGKRKTAIARVWIMPGSGKFKVNNKDFEDYFSDNVVARHVVEQPFNVTGTSGKFDIICTVKGGGKSAQAEAIRHGVARALIVYNEELRPSLKKAGFLTRDARVKERKKYGLRGARRGQQYSKR